MNTDNDFAQRIYSDFEFATEEFKKAEIELKKEDYEKFVNARKAFDEATKPIFSSSKEFGEVEAEGGTEVTGTVGIKRTF
jgi:hypothetical protein